MAPFVGLLYRALDAVWQLQPLSGEGARLYGGRFNAKGVKCLYTALHPITALAETMQGIGKLQPTAMGCYEADYDDILDLSDQAKVIANGYNWSDMIDDSWRIQMKVDGISKSQQIANDVISKGYPGMLVKSFAPGSPADGVNAILWEWEDHKPNQLLFVDDENRQSRLVDKILSGST